MSTKRRNFLHAASLCLVTAIATGSAQAGGFLLVGITNSGNGSVGKYDAVTGAQISSSFLSMPISGAHPMVVDQNNHLFLVGNPGVAEFDASSGATINAQFVNAPGLNAQGIALDGKNHLFVSDIATNTVGEYDATTGATINRNFVQGVGTPNGLAVDKNNHLFVSNEDMNVIGEYDATTGATINAAFIRGLLDPSDLHIDGLGRLSVAFGSLDSSLIGAFDATTAAATNPFYFVGLGFPEAFALDENNHLFEANFNGSVGEYDATTGALINANFATVSRSAGYPTGIVYVPAAVPEPSTIVLVGIGILCSLVSIRKRTGAFRLA